MSEDKNKVKDFFQLGAVGNYFFRVFRKPDPNQKTNFNLRTMHAINKISIIMFLGGVIIMILKRVL